MILVESGLNGRSKAVPDIQSKYSQAEKHKKILSERPELDGKVIIMMESQLMQNGDLFFIS